MTTPYRYMNSAPRGGKTVLLLLRGSSIPHAARFIWDAQRPRWTPLGERQLETTGWVLVADGRHVEAKEGPRYWMPVPADPDPNEDRSNSLFIDPEGS